MRWATTMCWSANSSGRADDPKTAGPVRIHAANDGGLASIDARKLRQRLNPDIEKGRLLQAVCGRHCLQVRHDPLGSSSGQLQYRLASCLVEPSARRFSQDTASTLVCRFSRSAARSSQMGLRDVAITHAWAVACMPAPRPDRRNLIQWRQGGCENSSRHSARFAQRVSPTRPDR